MPCLEAVVPVAAQRAIELKHAGALSEPELRPRKLAGERLPLRVQVRTDFGDVQFVLDLLYKALATG